MEESKNILSESSKLHMMQTVSWARYSGIISIVNLILSFFQFAVGGIKGNPLFMLSFFGFIISGAISLYMAINLLNYAKFLKMGIEQENSTKIYEALYHLRVYFKIIGILFIVLLSLIALFIIVAIIAAISKL